MKKLATITLLLLLFCTESFAQKKEEKVIQFSGYTVTADSLIGVPFVHITVLRKGRLAMAGPDGYFSFPAVAGDTLYFTSVGYTPVRYIVPEVKEDKFWVVQLMTKNDNYLPTTIIYPWGDRSNFPQAFIDTRLPDDDLQRAKRNLDAQTLAAIGETLEHNGEEASSLALRTASAKKYYYGQAAPQNIFNPLAWAEFIKAWKRGDFKKKDSPTNLEEQK